MLLLPSYLLLNEKFLLKQDKQKRQKYGKKNKSRAQRSRIPVPVKPRVRSSTHLNMPNEEKSNGEGQKREI
jgi:hypothetical protein